MITWSGEHRPYHYAQVTVDVEQQLYQLRHVAGGLFVPLLGHIVCPSMDVHHPGTTYLPMGNVPPHNMEDQISHRCPRKAKDRHIDQV